MMERVHFRRGPTVALLLGAVGLIGGVLTGLGSGFYESYLLSYLFWVGLSLGCLILLVVGHLAGGSWAAVIQRPLEAGVSLMPVMALAFLPVLFGMNVLYVWTDAQVVADSPLLDAKSAYLNTTFFVVRAAVYFGLWILAAWWYLRGSARQDRDADQSARIGYRLKHMSGPWVVLYIVTMTFAGVDWAMSLTPLWWSGIYSVILMASQAITAIAFVILVMVLLAGRSETIDGLLTAKRLQDLGNYLMAFVLFWAYVSFSQLIIIWSGNVIETNPWYVVRFDPAWASVAGFLLLFGFLAPFLVLFSRWVKRKRTALAAVAAWAILMQLINLIWFVVPTYERAGTQLTVPDVLLLLGIGGVWLFFYFRRLGANPVLPHNDPRLKGADPHA
ncbi:MAG: hypothetical protein U5K81_12375 [Trueperaceae bacterium]|nr:hypothetical protein [Trueperaceae bacterium]